MFELAPTPGPIARGGRALAIGAIAAATLAIAASTASAATLYVSPRGSSHSRCTRVSRCKTIGRAVRLARAGDRILVSRGTYREDVRISKAISVIGAGMPRVDARGHANGFLIRGSRAAGAKVRGFLVEHATFEGILATSTSNVTISGNRVIANDLGVKAAHPVGECAPVGPIPGDCGEGIHLMSVMSSTVSSNLVQGNAGGILLTDELGPTALNLIARNRSLNNVLDCGITLAGHSTSAVTSSGATEPKLGGVYDNLVTGNTANGNGTVGKGGGILLAAGAPGSAVYDNVVDGNTADGNGLAGITLHSHAPGQNLNGNVITDNSLSGDGVTGDPDFGVKHTVGILVASAVTTLSGTEIANNSISNTYYGIWTKNVPPLKASANSYANVTVPLAQS